MGITYSNTNNVEYIFGCRNPSSAGIGKWDGAFVVCKSKNDQDITAALFENNADFIGHPKTYDEAIAKYEGLIAQGWKPMGIEDLEKTTGVGANIDDQTIIGL